MNTSQNWEHLQQSRGRGSGLNLSRAAGGVGGEPKCRQLGKLVLIGAHAGAQCAQVMVQGCCCRMDSTHYIRSTVASHAYLRQWDIRWSFCPCCARCLVQIPSSYPSQGE